MLHPCQTDEVMRLVTREAAATDSIDGVGASTRDGEGGQPAAAMQPPHAVDPLLYMMAWLSIAGQWFKLALPVEAWREYWHAKGVMP